MKIVILNISFLVLLASAAVAQLSPGDLSAAHAKLEGMSNCTQCHVLGSKVSNDKCLACHKEIKSLMDKREGYHVSRDVKGKDCATCHSDHHGRNFDMVRFDEKNFNHSLAGYALEGAHKKVDCRECHKPDNIDDYSLKKRKDTFLGMGKQCLDCHDDYHQKTLSNDCGKCHGMDDFKPATKFNHDKTDFALAGKHKTVDCKECHKMEVKNGKEFQHFADVASKNCNACHDDPHRSHLGSDCKQCHNEQSFQNTSSLTRFNHNQTHFALKGKHKQVDCKDCHNMVATMPTSVFQDRLGVKTNECATCHRDPHEGKFGQDCAGCHNESSFHKIELGSLENFNHTLTGFELAGKHAAVDCKKCHTADSFTDPLPHNTCAACHSDYHEGQFNTPRPPQGGLAKAPDCAECHTVDGFQGSSFSIEQHGRTKFPLDGAHVATPCFACHLKEDKWLFRKIGERCVDCHVDIHKQGNELAEKWYPNQDCKTCHVTESWSAVGNFDHNKTKFQLKGKHQQVDCRECHVQEPPERRFAGLAQECASCHADNHAGQFERDGVTDCARCHGNDDWVISSFNHQKTQFPLEGKHAETACDKCHLPKEINEVVTVQYKFVSFECVVCHK
ncbi:MAG: cytochrome c family protein [Bacteroidetes bacterium]|nr:cytochrome c family protein [Bacteroidota bacterium]